MEGKTLTPDLQRELLRQFLIAWGNSIEQQRRLLRELAHTLGSELSTIYYDWVKPPHCLQTGLIYGTNWSFVFHGFADCDLKHESDGRFLQVSFGPQGRFDVFSAWGTMQYVMASKYPWPDYAALKHFLAEQNPPFNHLSGSYARMRRLIQPLKHLGIFKVIDRDLLRLKAELAARYTRVDGDGRRIYEPPDPFNDPDQDIFWDLEVAHTQGLTERGKRLFAGGVDEEEFAELWARHSAEPAGLNRV